jgi:hypothetical protein
MLNNDTLAAAANARYRGGAVRDTSVAAGRGSMRVGGGNGGAHAATAAPGSSTGDAARPSAPGNTGVVFRAGGAGAGTA